MNIIEEIIVISQVLRSSLITSTRLSYEGIKGAIDNLQIPAETKTCILEASHLYLKSSAAGSMSKNTHSIDTFLLSQILSNYVNLLAKTNNKLLKNISHAQLLLIGCLFILHHELPIQSNSLQLLPIVRACNFKPLEIAYFAWCFFDNDLADQQLSTLFYQLNLNQDHLWFVAQLLAGTNQENRNNELIKSTAQITSQTITSLMDQRVTLQLPSNAKSIGKYIKLYPYMGFYLLKNHPKLFELYETQCIDIRELPHLSKLLHYVLKDNETNQTALKSLLNRQKKLPLYWELVSRTNKNGISCWESLMCNHKALLADYIAELNQEIFSLALQCFDEFSRDEMHLFEQSLLTAPIAVIQEFITQVEETLAAQMEEKLVTYALSTRLLGHIKQGCTMRPDFEEILTEHHIRVLTQFNKHSIDDTSITEFTTDKEAKPTQPSLRTGGLFKQTPTQPHDNSDQQHRSGCTEEDISYRQISK